MTVDRTHDTSGLRESLAAEFGSEVASDFEAMLGSLAGVRRSEVDLDEVAIIFLAAA